MYMYWRTNISKIFGYRMIWLLLYAYLEVSNVYFKVVHITYVTEPCNYVCIHIIRPSLNSNNIYIHYSYWYTTDYSYCKTQIPTGWHAHLVLSVSQGCPLPHVQRWSEVYSDWKLSCNINLMFLLWRCKKCKKRNKTLMAGPAGDSKHCKL